MLTAYTSNTWCLQGKRKRVEETEELEQAFGMGRQNTGSRDQLQDLGALLKSPDSIAAHALVDLTRMDDADEELKQAQFLPDPDP